MPGVAIVAIPAQDDYVWRISSEKVPHMTLLYLGDMVADAELANIENFLAHVVDTEIFSFGMDVESRGVLGPDNADVVFFRKDHGYKEINAARIDMLADPHIRQAYAATDQYDEWTAHLTLGYPATPAKPDPRDYPGVKWVTFDKIALWIGDYTGPEFPLKEKEYSELAMSYAGVTLEHHGVKGMRWGVRKDGSTSSTTVRTSNLRRPAKDVVARQKPGQFVRTSGGNRQTASEDAVRVAATRQLAKKSTTDTLSNKQLQDAVTRMNLEQQYHTLAKRTNRQTRGQRFIHKFIGSPKPVDKNGNPLPGSSPSVATHAATLIGQLLKNKSK